MARRVEAIWAARAIYGAALMAAPRRALGGGAFGADEPDAILFARLLGARQLLESAILVWRPRRRVLLAGAAVDAAHGVTMIALYAISPSRRRLAAASASIAAVLAASGLVVGLRTPA